MSLELDMVTARRNTLAALGVDIEERILIVLGLATD